MEFMWLLLLLPLMELKTIPWILGAFCFGMWLGRRRCYSRARGGNRPLLVWIQLVLFLATPVAAAEISAMYVGTDKDRTGIDTASAPDGAPDYEVLLAGLREEKLISVRIEADNGGAWEVPINKVGNWHVAIERAGVEASARLFFSVCNTVKCGNAKAGIDPTAFKIALRYESGVTESISDVAVPPPLKVTPENPTPYATTQPPPGVVTGTILLHITLTPPQAVFCDHEIPIDRIRCWVGEATGAKP